MSERRVPWTSSPSIEIELASRHPWGDQSVLAPEICMQGVRELMADMEGQIPDKAKWLARGVRLQTGGRFDREAGSIARMLNREKNEVILASVAYDLAINFIACSVMLLEGEGGPVLARNMDWWPEAPLARGSCTIRYRRGGKPLFANAGWPGSIGVVTGMSFRGFGVSLNAVLSDKQKRRSSGYPAMLMVRRVLEDAGSFDEAVALLTDTELASPCLLGVVGRERGERVVIERSQRDAHQRWAEDDTPLFVTNHYRVLEKSKLEIDLPGFDAGAGCGRYGAMECMVDAGHASLADDDSGLLYLLTDDRVQMEITAQHVIIRPCEDLIRMWVPSRLLEGP